MREISAIIAQFLSFFFSLGLFSRWFLEYTGSAKANSSILVEDLTHDHLNQQESRPLLTQENRENDSITTNIMTFFKNYIRLLKYSVAAAFLLFGISISEFIYSFLKESIDVSDIALMFHCILIITVSAFICFEYNQLKSSTITNHNRQDRFTTTIHHLTNYISIIWIQVIIINVGFEIETLVYDENTLSSIYFSSAKLSIFVMIAVVFTMLKLWLPRQIIRTSAAVESPWKHAVKNVRTLSKFIWPQTFRLQLLIFACMIILIVGRVVNVLVPIQYKVVVDSLTSEDGQDKRPFIAWGAILIFISLRFLQGGVGLLSTLQNFMWIPIGQYSTKEISVRMLEHLHALSLTFHLKRKTGEVLRVMDRGTTSVGALLSYILFNILPVFVDIAVAVIYFVIEFDWTFGLIVFSTMALYITLTIWITEWRTKFRRDVNDLDNACQAASVDSLLNFETVKYYANEKFEVEKFSKAIDAYQAADWKSNATLNILNTAQNTTITAGLLVGCLLCADRVVQGRMTVGEFVLFMTYILQLYQPLNWFGTYYRVIQKNFIDMEQMMKLFEENPEIKDLDHATDLSITDGGKVIFENVSFAYDERTPVLQNISFVAEPGQTIALVGPSGGGKSTVFRLLFRFYEANKGRVLIDGQDIREVTQFSLRKQIGVVPQDCVLFNNSIQYNIQYGNIDAPVEDVIEAAKSAKIHEKILTFPDGYNTIVGERGLRLSGGEKQRVAIARTLLKDPAIILLDEATSALDNTTERHIQATLETVYSSTKLRKRTKLVIAHRLSTTMNADQILVIKNGQIVERGKHSELIQNGILNKIELLDVEPETVGSYYYMWMVQLEKEKNSAN